LQGTYSVVAVEASKLSVYLLGRCRTVHEDALAVNPLVDVT